MRKLEFDGIIGAIDEKTNKLVLRVGSETSTYSSADVLTSEGMM